MWYRNGSNACVFVLSRNHRHFVSHYSYLRDLNLKITCIHPWWWTGRPGVLRFMQSQRVGHNWATELTDWHYPPKSLHIHFYSVSAPIPSPRESSIILLSLWICLFWTLHLNGIIQYMVFCDCLLLLSIFSTFIHIEACISISSFLIAE